MSFCLQIAKKKKKIIHPIQIFDYLHPRYYIEIFHPHCKQWQYHLLSSVYKNKKLKYTYRNTDKYAEDFFLEFISIENYLKTTLNIHCK